MIRALHVFPLFGQDLTNGSEQVAYHLTQSLAQQSVAVDVVTTRACQLRLPALFAAQWHNDFGAKSEALETGTLRRFSVMNLPPSLGRALSVLVWRRWQREALRLPPLPDPGAERVAALFQRARARPKVYHWLALLGLGPWSWPMRRWLRAAICNYDVVLVSFSPLALVWQVTQLARRSGTPVVILPLAHLDDLYHHLTPLYTSYVQASALLTMTRYSTALFKQLLPGSHPVEVGAGVDVAEFSDPQISGERFRARYGLTGCNLVLYVGRKEPAKCWDLAVAALEALGRPDCRLVMVGEDVDGRPISSAHVSALGKLPRAEVLDAYDACQVFILPSESESFSLVILEAWLRRKPVIGNAACGPVAALIEPGVDGYLCAGPQAMAQRIGELLDDPTRCAQMGMAGYQKVLARYTWERVSHNVLKVYQQVIDGTNRTARPLTT